MIDKEKLIGQSSQKAPTGYIQHGQHCYPYRIAYQDTDAGKIMYHGNHARAAERARLEMMALLTGIDSNKSSQENLQNNYEFVVRTMNTEFFAPLFLYDEVLIKTTVKEMGKTSLTLRQDFISRDKKVSTIGITLVYVDLEKMRPKRIDDFWRNKFEYITQN